MYYICINKKLTALQEIGKLNTKKLMGKVSF
jgi:hypothetical protein